MANVVPVRIGGPYRNSGAVGSLATAFQPIASNSQCEVLFEPPEDFVATRVAFLYGARTGTPPIQIASLQSLNASTALPSGTVLGGGSPASVLYTPPATTAWDLTWRELTLANSIQLLAGTGYALVLGYSSGTIDGSNCSSYRLLNAGFSAQRFPYAIQNVAGVRTAQTAGIPIFGVGSATKMYGLPMNNVYTATIDSTTTPDEIAITFNIPATRIGGTYAVAGVAFTGTCAASMTVLMQLYSGTTPIQTRSWNSNQSGATASTGYFEIMFPTPLVTLSPGVTYRIGFQPQAGSAAFGLRGFTVNSAADLDAYPEGQNFYSSSRTDGGAWTDVPTRRHIAELILADITGRPGRLINGGLVR